MKRNATIARITAARVTHYRDNGETTAYVTWVDSRGRTGTTMGNPDSAHMQALLARAKREGVRVVKDQAGWLPNSSSKIEPGLKKAYEFFRKAEPAGIVGESGKGALDLARAEKHAEENGWYAEWTDDPEPYDTDNEDDQPFEVLNCVLKDDEGNVLAGLGGIGMSGNTADDKRNGRVIEAQLALEAMHEKGLTPNGSTEDDAREFNRRRNMVGTTVRHMSAGRTFDVVLENRGSELGSRTDILKRGKVESSHYYLPPLPAFLKNRRAR